MRHTHIDTHKHTTIALGEMQCVAFRLRITLNGATAIVVL